MSTKLSSCFFLYNILDGAPGHDGQKDEQDDKGAGGGEGVLG